MKKKYLKKLFLENVIVVVIVAIATTVLDTGLENIKKSNQIELDSLRSSNERKLEEIKLANDVKLTELELSNERLMLENTQKFELITRKMDSLQQLELIKQSFQNRLIEMHNQFRNDLTKINAQVEGNITVDKSEINLDFVTRQLSEFYWPVYYRLEKNNSLEHMLNNVILGDEIENDLMRNHLKIVEILEAKMHLAQPNSEMIDEMKKYIAHVNTFSAIDNSGLDVYPEHFGVNYPSRFFELIRGRTKQLQNQYNDLIGLKNQDADIPRIDTLTRSERRQFNDLEFRTLRLSYKKGKYIKYQKIDSTLKIVLKEYFQNPELIVFEVQKIEDSSIIKKLLMKVGDRKWLNFNQHTYEISVMRSDVKEEGGNILKYGLKVNVMVGVKKWKDIPIKRLD